MSNRLCTHTKSVPEYGPWSRCSSTDVKEKTGTSIQVVENVTHTHTHPRIKEEPTKTQLLCVGSRTLMWVCHFIWVPLFCGFKGKQEEPHYFGVPSKDHVFPTMGTGGGGYSKKSTSSSSRELESFEPNVLEVGANKNTIKIIAQNTPLYAQDRSRQKRSRRPIFRVWMSGPPPPPIPIRGPSITVGANSVFFASMG